MRQRNLGVSVGIISGVALLTSSACTKSLDPPPAKMTVTQSIFTPVYRASKAIQGATGPGVTYVKFGELLQGLSTEIAIAKDQQMNEIDKRLIGKYEELLSAYKFSAELWQVKIQNSEEYWKGYIPVGWGGAVAHEFSAGVSKFKLPTVERAMPYTGAKYIAVAGDSVQAVWASAGLVADAATEIYYGRSDGAPTPSPSAGAAK